MSESLRAAMRHAELDYAGPLHADGRLHRFKAGEDRERNSWFIIFPGPPAAGSFGCWKRGFKENWCERNGQLSQAEGTELRRRWQEVERERERAETERHLKARKTAAWILSRSQPATAKHAYLIAKRVKPHVELREYHDSLVVPLLDVDGVLHSLQFIGAVLLR